MQLSIFIACRLENIPIEHFDCLPSGNYCQVAFQEHWYYSAFRKMQLSICIACCLGNIPIEQFYCIPFWNNAKLHSNSINIARRSGNIAIEHFYLEYCYWAFLLLAVRKWLLSCIPEALMLLGVPEMLRLSICIACRPGNIAIEHVYCLPSGNDYQVAFQEH